MPELMLDLSLDNLDEIEQLLLRSYEKSVMFLNSFDFDERIEPSPEKRQMLNVIMDRMGGYVKEISHVDSFLQGCDLTDSAITVDQQKGIIGCQALCKKIKDNSRDVMQWVVKVKAQFDTESCPVINDAQLNLSEKKSAEFIENETTVTSEVMQAYDQARAIFKDIHSEVMYTDPENMISNAGRRLEVMSGKTLHVETEHEMDLLVDYGLFHYRKDGKNIVDRYVDANKKLYSGDKLNALLILKSARFSFLKVIKPVDEYGTVVFDALTNETLILIDRGIHQLAKKHENYAILTHYLVTPGFIMTTGVSTPVNLNTLDGAKMQTMFEKLIAHHQGERKLDQGSYFQCITDLFKTVIHENITKTVASKHLPMNHHHVHGPNCQH